MTSPGPAPAADETSVRFEGWRVVAACFCMASFGWGLGFYGHSVYLAELQRVHGWPASLIATATTCFYLAGALLVTFISEAMRWLGPRNCLLAGIACMAAAVALLGQITAPWQLFAVYGLMAVGWAGTTLGAVTTTLGLWFNRRRGMAISLALNGASFGGILGVPLMVIAIAAFGFPLAMAAAAGAMILLLVPMMVVCIGTPPPAPAMGPDRPDGAPVRPPQSPARIRAEALRSVAFLTVAIPFACVLFAQVGFVVHAISFLDPMIGRQHAAAAVVIVTVMAVVGRVLVSTVIDRFNQRLAASLSFVSHALALLLFINASNVMLVYAAAALFGFSVGNMITLPALIIQREFDASAFSVLISLNTAVTQIAFSFGPGVIGFLRDLSGSYVVPFSACIGLQLIAAMLVLVRGKPRPAAG